MYRTTARFLCTFTGYPVKTTFLTVTLYGSAPLCEPIATNYGLLLEVPAALSSGMVIAKTGNGGKAIGA